MDYDSNYWDSLKRFGKSITRSKDKDYNSQLKEMEAEIEKLIQQRELREKKKELDKLKHPNKYEAKKSISRSGSRVAKFLGSLAKESYDSYEKSKRTLSKGPSYRQSGNKSFVMPEGNDISLSGAIRDNNWSPNNVMDYEFFNPDRNNTNILGNSIKSLDLVSNKSGIDLLGNGPASDNKNKKDKLELI